MSDTWRETNRRLWDELASIHPGTAFYGLDRFKAGEDALLPIELAEMGDVAGKSLLHLQCHIGLDTLNWARKGARVTGLDFSGEAVRQARKLAAETGLAGEFVEADVYDARAAIKGQFDYLDEKEFPNAKNADPRDFYDNSFVETLAKSGFLKTLGMK